MHLYIVDKEVASENQPVVPVYTGRDVDLGALLDEVKREIDPEVGYVTFLGAELVLNLKGQHEISYVVRGPERSLLTLSRKLSVLW